MNKTPRKWIMGNWKLNPENTSDAISLIHDIEKLTANTHLNSHLAVAPSFLHLVQVKEKLPASIHLMAQDVSIHNANTGAFTGDISAAQLTSVGVSHVLVGHSERRIYQQETPSILSKKITAALEKNLHVVFCVGESQTSRENNNHLHTITEQIDHVFNTLDHAVINQITADNFIIAYEPVWAIGTGLHAKNDDIEEMHAHIRDQLSAINTNFSAISILYGGSVKPNNANTIKACQGVDGVLVGGASLDAEQFLDIAKAFG